MIYHRLRSPVTAQNMIPRRAIELAGLIGEAEEEELLAEAEAAFEVATADEGGREVVVAAELVGVVGRTEDDGDVKRFELELAVVVVNIVEFRNPMLVVELAGNVEAEAALGLCMMDVKVERRAGAGADHVSVVGSEHCGPVDVPLLQHVQRPVALL